MRPRLFGAAIVSALMISADAGMTKDCRLTLYFGLDQSELSPLMQNVLMSFLAHNPSAYGNVIGHTDALASQQYNIELSRRRALTVVNFIEQYRAGSVSLTTDWRGKMDLVVNSPNAEALNRRVEIYYHNCTPVNMYHPLPSDLSGYEDIDDEGTGGDVGDNSSASAGGSSSSASSSGSGSSSSASAGTNGTSAASSGAGGSGAASAGNGGSSSSTSGSGSAAGASAGNGGSSASSSGSGSSGSASAGSGSASASSSGAGNAGSASAGSQGTSASSSGGGGSSAASAGNGQTSASSSGG